MKNTASEITRICLFSVCLYIGSVNVISAVIFGKTVDHPHETIAGNAPGETIRDDSGKTSVTSQTVMGQVESLPPGVNSRQVNHRVVRLLQQQLLADPQSAQASDARQKLQALFRRLANLSWNTPHVSQSRQRSLTLIQLAYSLRWDALAQQRLSDAAHWLDAIRTEARKLQQRSNPQDKILGCYWTMLVNIAEIRQRLPNMPACQRACLEQLQIFLDQSLDFAPDQAPMVMKYRRQAQLAMLTLYDQLGMSRQVARQVAQLKSQASTHQALREYLNQAYGYCDLLGTPFNVKLRTIEGNTWDSRALRGKPLVLYFWPGIQPGKKDLLWRQLQQLHWPVLLVDMSHAKQTGLALPASPWPVYRRRTGDFSLAEMFHVQSLPRLVLIDRDGKIKAIGSAGLIDQLTSRHHHIPERQKE